MSTAPRAFARGAKGAAAAALFVLAAAAPAQGADAKAGEAKAQPCAACHGANGNSTDPTVPSLAGQPPVYIQFQLIQFREQRRKDERMGPFAAKLSDADMKDLGAYFSALAPAVPSEPADAARMAAGKAVADRNHCGSCHMPDYSGQKHIARLAGQHNDYLLKQLRGFKDGSRPDIDGMMVESAATLTDADIVAVSYYLSRLKP